MNIKIKIKEKEIDLIIKNITKKSIKLFFSNNNELILHKPKNYPLSKAKKFIIKNEEKILQEFLKLNSKKVTKEFHYLGELIEFKEKKDQNILNFSINKKEKLLIVYYNKNIPEKIKKEEINKIKLEYFQNKLSELILFYIKKHNKKLNQKINKIKIKNLKSRWGSCSTKKNLNFNLKLICFSQEVIEYVVVHEMCHLIYMNHSKDFWKLVEDILPDYEFKKKRLNEDIKIPELFY